MSQSPPAPQEDRVAAARMLMGRADEVLEIARRARDFSPASSFNRAFYACFYAASAVLVLDGRTFVKHTGVRAAVHGDLIKSGRLRPEFGQIYNELFDDRSEADYMPTAVFTPEDAGVAIEKATRFVEALRALLPPGVV
jgi:uncharacterized protein (UPF0332 family)